jgi:hypothetical protein
LARKTFALPERRHRCPAARFICWPLVTVSLPFIRTVISLNSAFDNWRRAAGYVDRILTAHAATRVKVTAPSKTSALITVQTFLWPVRHTAR